MIPRPVALPPPDLLWAAFPSHTPYHYAYNSPLIWSDSSGLEPEKERDREKLLNIELDWDGVYNVWNEIQYENGRMAMMDFSSYMMDFKEAFNTRFGESSGGGRTGASSGAENGTNSSSSSGFWASLWNSITNVFKSSSEWVWEGVDYGVQRH